MGRKASSGGRVGPKTGRSPSSFVGLYLDEKNIVVKGGKDDHQNGECDALTHPSPPTLGTRRSQRSLVIKNSSPRDSDADTEDMDLGGDYMKGPSRLVFKEVAVPFAKSNSKLSQALSPTSLSTSSDVSSRNVSNEYDTPETSAAPTPGELNSYGNTFNLHAERITRRSIRSLSTPSALRVSNINGTKRKRSTGKVEEQLLTDELLAQVLQKEEYAEDTSRVASKSRRHNARIADTDDELDSLGMSSLSELDSEELASEISVFLDSPKAKKAKTSGRNVLPTRNSGSNNRKSLTPQSGLGGIEDATDEEDDLYSSGLDVDTSDMDESHDETRSRRTRTSIPTRNGQSTDTTFAAPSSSNLTNARNRPSRRMRAGMSRAERERDKLEHAHPEIKTLWDDLKDIPIIVPDRAEQPKAITRPLKSFQLEGLDWMSRQEKSKWKGGLLGDEMGMGKTIQAVSLIMLDYPAKDPTLVIVPPVALMQWSTEIAEYTDGKLKVLIHHNTDPKVKKLTIKDLKKYDVIMISYSGLESIYRKESKGWKRDDGLVKENSRIHAIHYHRLILDEAHSIKTRTTSVAKACFALKASYKWCLSGTPVQNRIGEFFSLLRFLEVTPFASYFCKVCSCAELHWSQNEEKKCTHCNHSGFSHVSIFNQELLTPITQAESPETRKEALGKLRLITDRIMLRRLKRDHVASMELPPKEVVVHNEFFGEIERDFSSSIMTNTARQFDTYVSRGVMLNNYANIFGLIMQMRQVANHPDLILKKTAEGGQNVLVCCICDETAEEPIRSRCHHEFCRKCAKDYVRSFQNGSGEPDCPSCHLTLAIDFDQPDIEQDEDHVKKNSIINRIKMEDWTSSTKIEMLIYDLYKLRSKKQTHKSIVFSQFTSMLQLVEWRLRRAGFNTVMLDGSMSPAQRQKSIEYFMNNVDVEVFLVSLKAGGVALNLTEASRVFIIDPWWNPAAEWQSADRCHRIGQKRPCVITRLCIEDSVESRMVLLQEKKANMISSTINHDSVAMDKLTPEDMQFLFRGN